MVKCRIICKGNDMVADDCNLFSARCRLATSGSEAKQRRRCYSAQPNKRHIYTGNQGRFIRR